MISLAEAKGIILNSCKNSGHEVRLLADALNYHLAEELTAKFPIPRFDNSAVDGFAVQSRDTIAATTNTPAKLQIAGTVHTGEATTFSLKSGQAARIFTGASIPNGADSVVMLEDTTSESDTVNITEPIAISRNIRFSGEEFKEGAVCIPERTRMTPPAIALASSLGVTQVRVFRKPSVALVITGSELVQPGEELGSSQIYDSNRLGLMTVLAEMGISVSCAFSCKDNLGETQNALSEALNNADVVITSGGASVGDVDYVKPALTSLGGEIDIESISIKPGKPTVHAKVGTKHVFGLPGNPVAALVVFALLVRPALQVMSGGVYSEPKLISARLGATVKKRTPRTEFVRATLSTEYGELKAKPCHGQQSHMLGGLVNADCLIVCDGEPGTIRGDDIVKVILLPWT
ncbi:MAG: molybdopterin molybdotransferase MoeA [Calditrichaeota bacterium]|nr:molybdopterin molybdotransferase MoeA [Calditrichota bacterium]